MCYQCCKPGHLAQDCRSKKSESQGRESVMKKQTPTTKQITTTNIDEDAVSGHEDPRDYLLPDSDEGNVKTVHVEEIKGASHNVPK